MFFWFIVGYLTRGSGHKRHKDPYAPVTPQEVAEMRFTACVFLVCLATILIICL